MYKNFFLLLVCSFWLLSACSQTNKEVIQAQGYFMIPTPGTIPVDDNGRPLSAARDSVFMLFIETKSKAIKWEYAWKDGRCFSLLSSQVTGKEMIERPKAGNRNIEMTTGKGNTLWKIELTGDVQKRKAPKPIDQHEILVQGRSGSKPFYVTIKSLTQLASPDYQ